MEYRRKIESLYQKSNDWTKVYTSAVNPDAPESQAAFVDYVEYTSKIRIEDIEHLRNATGIGDLDAEVFRAARLYQYSESIAAAIRKGAPYGQLTEIESAGLSEQESAEAMLSAIAAEFRLGAGISRLPNLRFIAAELQAPYSLIMAAYKSANPIIVSPEDA